MENQKNKNNSSCCLSFKGEATRVYHHLWILGSGPHRARAREEVLGAAAVGAADGLQQPGAIEVLRSASRQKKETHKKGTNQPKTHRSKQRKKPKKE